MTAPPAKGRWAADHAMLEGSAVRLEPLSTDHVEALCRVGLDDSIWEWSPFGIRDRDEMTAYVEAALAERSRGLALPFATIERASGTVVGSTRFDIRVGGVVE